MRAWCFVVVMSSFATAAVATTVPPLTVHELSARADLAAVVTLTEQHAAWVGTRILTFCTATVDDTWLDRSAHATRTVHFALPGGVVGDVGQRVPGTPSLVVGGHYLLFLGPDNGPPDPVTHNAARAIVGLWRGAFVVDGARAVPFSHDDTQAPVPLAVLHAQVLARDDTSITPTPPALHGAP
jgi:hypothetical protein